MNATDATTPFSTPCFLSQPTTAIIRKIKCPRDQRKCLGHLFSLTPSLRDTVAAGLATLPNATRLGLTVVSSTPKRTTTLFPYASPAGAVRCWETEHLVVVDCGLPADCSADAANGANTTSNGDSNGDAAAPSTSTPPSPPRSVLAAAISVYVYTLPGNKAAPPTTLVYISKVDSSGYASSAGPLTRELAVGVLTHFLGPGRPQAGGRVLATLFARSQGQYLFPNSIEGGGKRVLGGLGLCQWWKGVYEASARRLVERGSASALHLRYLLPSYTAAEAAGMLRAPAVPPPVEWAYAPPFVAPIMPLSGSLAALIPGLPDDPKTRFLDELAGDALDASPYTHKTDAPGSTTGDAPPSPKRRRKEREAAADEQDRKRTHAALAKVPAEEFWERLGFRQECSSGDVTGFFCIEVEPVVATGAAAAAAEGDEEKDKATVEAVTMTTAEPPAHDAPTVPQHLVERILKSLLNTDFGTSSMAADGTRAWLDSTRRLVVDEVGEPGWEKSVTAIDAKGDQAGGERKRKDEVVTVLQVRKKKK